MNTIPKNKNTYKSNACLTVYNHIMNPSVVKYSPLF